MSSTNNTRSSARFHAILAFIICLLGWHSTSTAQLVVQSDTTICQGSPVTLSASLNISGTGGINFSNLTTVNLTDDVHSPVVPIGFSFDFYGATHTQCVIASNNYLTFDLTQANNYSPWSINNAIPNTGMPRNAIMCPYQDINPGVGGVIEYGTTGTAPNRIFVVRFLAVPMFGCTQLEFCSAIFLFEGSNRIETHIENKPLCTTWNGGVAIHGLHNAAGTSADVVPGRNYPTQWTATQDAWEFIPNGGASYTINTTTFLSILSNNNTINWYEVGGPQVGTGPTLTVTPNTTTSYWADVSVACGGQGQNLMDTATVTVIPVVAPTVVVTDESCGGSLDGAVDITPNSGSAPFTFDLQDGGGNSIANITTGGPGSLNNLPGGNYTLIVTDSFGCSTTTPIVIATAPPVTITSNVDTLICQGGSVTLSAIGAGGAGAPYVFTWNQGLVGNGPHVVTPGTQTEYTVFATDPVGCVSQIDTITVDVNPFLTTTVSMSTDTICPGEFMTVTASVTGGSGVGYTYSWDDGNGVIGNGPSIIVSPADDWQYCITVTDDCETPASQACVVVPVADLPPATFSVDTVAACIPATITFTNTTPSSAVGSAEWTFGDGTTSDATTVVSHTYEDAGVWDISLTITTPEGCVTDTFMPGYISTYGPPEAYFEVGPQPTTIFNTEMTFTNGSVDNLYNDWNFANIGTSTDEHPVFTFPPGISSLYEITLLVTNQWDCTDSYSVTINIEDEQMYYVPNSFTPNGDGINDFFYGKSLNVSENDFEFYIFNRWGELVWSTTDPNEQWDGTTRGSTKVQDGVYAWKIRGRTYSKNQKFEVNGHVTVIR